MDKEENMNVVGLDYKLEYYRLKEIEKENIELKETIINMSKILFRSQNILENTLKDIERELKSLSRRK